MGHHNNAILARISALLNTKVFSDVEFHVKGDDDNYEILYAHKLILSMAGEGFAKLFYSKPSNVKSVKITDFTPHVFKLMLQFVYCDRIQISSLEDAMDLVKISKKYVIHDLMQECNAYICKFPLNMDTLFAKYEYSLCNRGATLAACRRLVSARSKEVFELPGFCNVSDAVIKDILKLEALSVPGEIDVINAAVRWGKAECQRKNKPGDVLCLRSVMLPLFKHLRFLTLNIQDFFSFDDTYGILLKAESTILIAKILDKNHTEHTVPDEFSSETMPRTFISGNVNNMPRAIAQPDVNNLNHPFYDLIKQADNFNLQPSVTTQPKATAAPNNIHVDSNHPYYPFQNQVRNVYHPPSVSTQPKVALTFNTSQRQNSSTAIAKSTLQIGMACEQKGHQTDGLPLYQYVPQKKSTPILKVIPQSKPRSSVTYEVKESSNISKPMGSMRFESKQLCYEFPLHEMQKEISSAFASDVKCTATIKMIRGTILVRGIELKVKDPTDGTDEPIEVYLSFFSNSVLKSESQTLQLKNSVLELPFDNPYQVSPGSPLAIEVLIEDLKLSRCSVCRSHENRCEVNSGLGVAAEIDLRSTQSNGGDNFFFLMSKLIYSVC